MGLFVMVEGLADEEIERELPALEMLLHFEYDLRSVHRPRSGLCLLHYAKNTYFYTDREQEFIATDDTGQIRAITVLQGYAWRSDTTTSSPLHAAQIADLIAQTRGDVTRMRACLTGEYAILHLKADGSCLAFNDSLGIEHIYFCQSRGLKILANRVSLAAHLAGDRDWDVASLLWLPLVGYRIGEGTRSPQVRMVPQSAYVEIRENHLNIHEKPCFLFQDFPNRATLRHDSVVFEQILDRGIAASLASLKATFEQGGPVFLPITGGKDSRLVLAFALQVFPPERLRLFTNGNADHPDVIVGRMVAERLGLAHEMRQPGMRHEIEADAKTLLRGLAIHAFQNDGMFGAWNLKAYPKAGFGVTPAGFVGEVFKGYLKKSFNFKKAPDPATFIALHGPYDPLGLFCRDARAQFDRVLRDRFASYSACGADFNDIPDLFYIKERIPNWLGGARQLDSYGRQVVNILNNEHLVKLAFGLDYRERQQEVLHFHLLRRLAPQLLDIPFAAQSWNLELQRYGALPAMFAPPVTGSSATPMHGSWQYTINSNVEYRQQLRDLFSAFPNSPVWDYLDRNVLLTRLNRGNFNMQQLISFYGLCTVFMAIHSYWIPMKMARHDGRPAANPIRIRNPSSGQTYRLSGERLLPCDEPSDEPTIDCLCTHWMDISVSSARPEQSNDEGTIDRVQDHMVSGWVWRPVNPGVRLRIAVIDFATGQTLDEFVADAFRGDLLRAGKGDGRYAFRYDTGRIRERLTGSKLAFRIQDSGFDLKRSPVTLE